MFDLERMAQRRRVTPRATSRQAAHSAAARLTIGKSRLLAYLPSEQLRKSGDRRG